MRDKNDTGHPDGVLLEDINHKFDVIVEYLAPLSSLPGDVRQLKDDMVDVKADVKTIKLAVKDQGKEHSRLVKQVARHWNKR